MKLTDSIPTSNPAWLRGWAIACIAASQCCRLGESSPWSREMFLFPENVFYLSYLSSVFWFHQLRSFHLLGKKGMAIPFERFGVEYICDNNKHRLLLSSCPKQPVRYMKEIQKQKPHYWRWFKRKFHETSWDAKNRILVNYIFWHIISIKDVYIYIISHIIALLQIAVFNVFFQSKNASQWLARGWWNPTRCERNYHLGICPQSSKPPMTVERTKSFWLGGLHSCFWLL